MKDNLRQLVKNMRDTLPDDIAQSKSEEIKTKLFRMSKYLKARSVLFYTPHQSEVNTEAMIRKALTEGKKVVLPRTDGEQRSIELACIRDYDKDLEPGNYQVLEPRSGTCTPVKPEELDLVILPGIAFDEKGNRLGYGKGYYDKFLKNVKAPCVALAYELQIVPQIPRDSQDVPVQVIVTEKRVIKCGKR